MTELPQWLDKAMNDIDAGFFSGDTFLSQDNRKALESYMARWQRWIAERLAERVYVTGRDIDGTVYAVGPVDADEPSGWSAHAPDATWTTRYQAEKWVANQIKLNNSRPVEQAVGRLSIRSEDEE